MNDLISFFAYHGTQSDNIEDIKRQGFKPSINDDWLGHGSYFFIDGLCDAKSSAKNWAVCSNWNKQTEKFNDSNISVVKTKITAPKKCIFDLRKSESINKYHLFRKDKLLKRELKNITRFNRPGERKFDTEILNDFRKRNGFNIAIANFHIQLSVIERYMRLDSRIPNVSVLSLLSNKHDKINCSIIEINTIPASDWIPKFNK